MIRLILSSTDLLDRRRFPGRRRFFVVFDVWLRLVGASGLVDRSSYSLHIWHICGTVAPGTRSHTVVGEPSFSDAIRQRVFGDMSEPKIAVIFAGGTCCCALPLLFALLSFRVVVLDLLIDRRLRLEPLL